MKKSSGSVFLALFLTLSKQTAMDFTILKRGTETDVGVASVFRGWFVAADLLTNHKS